jgi:hypothetical protein
MGALWARRTLVPVSCLTSPFIVALRERGPTAIHDRYPRSGRVSDRKINPEIRPEDHIPNTSGSNPRCTYMWPRPGGLVSRHGDVTDHGNPHNHHHAPPSMVQCSRTSTEPGRDRGLAECRSISSVVWLCHATTLQLSTNQWDRIVGDIRPCTHGTHPAA